MVQTKKEQFIALMKEKDPEAYRVAVEKGWLDSILDDIGFGNKNPVNTATTIRYKQKKTLSKKGFKQKRDETE